MKGKVYKIITALFALAFIIISAPVQPAQAQCTLNIYPSSGEVGDVVTVTGSDLYLSQSATFRLYFTDSAVDLNDDKDKYIEDELISYRYFPVTNIIGDSFTQTVKIPEFFNNKPVGKDGAYYFYLVKLTSVANKYAIVQGVPFRITGFTQAALTPTQGNVGDELEISGDGFWPGEELKILFDGIDITSDYLSGEPKAVASGASAGTFNVVVPVPVRGQGTKEVKIIGQNSAIEVVRNFTVLPKITLTPVEGEVSAQIIVRGTGFSQSANIYFGNAFIGQVTTINGTFMESITIPAGTAPGTYSIKAEDSIRPASINASASFDIIVLLSAPELIEPASDQQEVPVNPTFSWTAVDSATSYDFQLGTDPGFSLGVTVNDNFTTLTYEHASPTLDYDTNYYWRVRALAQDGSFGPWSSIQVMRTLPETIEPVEVTKTLTVTVTSPPLTTTVTVTSPPSTIVQTKPPVTVTQTKTAVTTTTAVGPTVTFSQPPVTVTQTVEPAPVQDDNEDPPNWPLVAMILGGATMAAVGIVSLVTKLRY